MTTLSVGIIGGLPRYIKYNGGLENQITSTMDALRSLGVDAFWLDRCASDIEIGGVDLVHAIGLNPNVAFNLQFLHPNAKLIVSPVSLIPSINWFSWNLHLSLRSALSRFKVAWALNHFRLTLQRADAVVCLSKVESLYLQKAFNVPSSKCFIISNGSHSVSDRPRFPKGQPSSSTLVCIGIIEPRKNQVLIERCARELGLAVEYHGRAGTDRNYNAQFTSLLSSSRSIWRGESDKETILKVHQSNSILLHYGTREGQPLVILDHLISGGRVILLDNRLNRELASVFTGLPIFLSQLAPAGLQKALRQAESFDHSSQTYQRRLSEAARLLTWSNVASRLVSIYEQKLYENI